LKLACKISEARVQPKAGWIKNKRHELEARSILCGGLRAYRLAVGEGSDRIYYRHYWVAYLEEYRASRKDPAEFIEEQYKSALSYVFYYDMHAGRKCPEWFHKAGLEDIRIEIQLQANIHPKQVKVSVVFIEGAGTRTPPSKRGSSS